MKETSIVNALRMLQRKQNGLFSDICHRLQVQPLSWFFIVCFGGFSGPGGLLGLGEDYVGLYLFFSSWLVGLWCQNFLFIWVGGAFVGLLMQFPK